MGVSNSSDDKNSITGSNEHIYNERTKSEYPNPSICASLYGFNVF